METAGCAEQFPGIYRTGLKVPHSFQCWGRCWNWWCGEMVPHLSSPLQWMNQTPFFILEGLSLLFPTLPLSWCKRHSSQQGQEQCPGNSSAGPLSCSKSAQCARWGTHSSANILAYAGLISGGEKWLTQARYFLAAILFTESTHKGFTNLNGDL